jgi:hypothetical protein
VDEGGVVWWRSRAVAARDAAAAAVLGVGATAVLPVASTPPLRSDHLGFLVGIKHGGELRIPCPGPHLLFNMALCDGGPRAIDLAVRPRSGRVTDSGSVVGPIRIEIKLTELSSQGRRPFTF